MFRGEASTPPLVGYLSMFVCGNCFGGSVPLIGFRKRAELFLMLRTDMLRLDWPIMPAPPPPWFVSF